MSTCYNYLGLGRWEELCHEVMSSVLPMNEPGMSGDDLSSPTWRIIFLKDDCFLQPSCDMTDTTSNNNTWTNDGDTTPSSDPIEPLFDGIDLNQYQQRHHYHHTIPPPSPSLSRSSSLPSLSDTEDTPKLSLSLKRKRKYTKKSQQQQQQRQRRKYDRPTTEMTLFDQLTMTGIDWCRYCGTTEGVNWRPGPWGKRTLCNKHGCDYKGYGLASRLPRLDLSGYRNEKVQDRHCPVIQEFCSICQERGQPKNRHKARINLIDDDNDDEMELVTCDGGCSRAFHRHCYDVGGMDGTMLWFCGSTCLDNRKKQRVVVDLPRKQPLMRSLKRDEKEK
ncbi:hypothetical protein BC941DRAFT_74560 [Chlamydoabsidia padenii]|nr:hypothetical protein BC941DRAFT_74560 [Chlamydoabsidia padenii]